MKYVDEFRDGVLAQNLAASIRAAVDPTRNYSFMEFCGGHTHALARYGVEDLLPSNVRMIHGPGCPVCVLPIGRIDMAIHLALDRGAIVCTYGDVMRVPASNNLSLMRAKARGGDIRMVYSPADALQLAQDNPTREVVGHTTGGTQRAQKFQCTVLPCAHTQCHHPHLAVARSGGIWQHTAERIFGSSACEHRHWLRALRAICIQLPKAGGDFRF
jgi:hydrogenase expression/formation protein HypD